MLKNLFLFIEMLILSIKSMTVNLKIIKIGGEIMRLKLYFELENQTISIQYRKSIISFIKHAIQEYDETLYQEIYAGNNKKTLTWAPILSKPKFEKEKIILGDTNFSIIF